MKNLGNMMKQAQQMQQRMAEMQAKLDETEMSGGAGAGMVTITLDGKGNMKKIGLDKSLLDPSEVEVLEDLILAAFADAKQKVVAHIATEMAKMTGGLQLPPGFKMPF